VAAGVVDGRPERARCTHYFSTTLPKAGPDLLNHPAPPRPPPPRRRGRRCIRGLKCGDQRGSEAAAALLDRPTRWLSPGLMLVEVVAALRRRTADGELRTEAAGGKSGNPRRCGAPRRHPARRRRGAGRDRSSARARHRTQGAGLRLSHPPRTRGLLVVDGRSASCSTCAIAQNRRWRRGQVSKRTPSTIITTTRRVEPSSERRTVVTSVVRRRCVPRRAPPPAHRQCGGPCTPGGSGLRSCPLLLRLPPAGRPRGRLRR
jgi:hypothetical protein